MNRNSRELIKKFGYVGFWTCLAGITFLSVTPHSSMVPSTLNDKANHVIAYFTLSFLYDISFASGLFPKGCFYLFLYGVLMEIIQYFIPGREFSFLDMGANGAGIVLFVLMSRIFRRRFVTQ